MLFFFMDNFTELCIIQLNFDVWFTLKQFWGKKYIYIEVEIVVICSLQLELNFAETQNFPLKAVGRKFSF